MRILILGTGPFALPSIKRLLADGHDCPLVVTRPHAELPGKKRLPAPVLDWAVASDLPVFQPPSINDVSAIERLSRERADLFFVCDYGQILSRDCLAATKLGGVNLHGSLLPRHRGAAPVQWSILSGDDEAGVSVIHMTPKLDAGPIVSCTRTPIMPDENALQLESRLAELGANATREAVALLAGWDHHSPLGAIQDPRQATRAPRFAKSDGQLDFRLPADYLARLIRALQPWPGAFAELHLEGNKVVPLHIRAARSIAIANENSPPPGTAWALEASDLNLAWPAPWRRLLAVQCRESLLLVGQLQPAGKRAMMADEFLRGHALSGHAGFSLPQTPCQPLIAKP